MQRSPLAATNRNPGSDARQIFQSNRSICVFRLRYNALTNAVVYIFCETMFFSREFLEFSFSRPRTFGLQFSPQAAVTVAHIVDVTGSVTLPIAVYSDIRYPQIHSQCALNLSGFWFFHLAGCRQEEHCSKDTQVALALPCLEQFSLPFTTHERDAKPPVYCPDRNSPVLHPPRQDAVIVSDASRSLECALPLSVEFIGICDFGNRPNRNLSRQVEFFSDCIIAGVMQVILPKGLTLPRIVADELASGVRLLNRLFERISLFWRREKFDLGDEFHTSCCSTDVRFLQVLKLTLLIFDVPLDGFCTDLARRSNLVTFRPQGSLFSPILAAKISKLLHQPTRTNAFKQAHNFGRRVFRRRTDKHMYVVRHYINRHNLKSVLRCYLAKEFFQTFRYPTNQNLLAIPRYPNKVIVANVHSMGCLFGGFIHALILSLPGVVVAASSTRLRRVVSAAQIL